MSTSGTISPTAPVSGRVRAYFAPVNRVLSAPSFFDAAQTGWFDLNSPPSPWLDLGWVSGFTRKTETKVGALRAGAPAIVQTQVRTEIEATLMVGFESWGKLQLAIAAGSEQMNLLATVPGAASNGSGGLAATAVPLTVGTSSATNITVGNNAATGFNVGDIVAVDLDYTGQTGYVGSGVSAAYVASSIAVNGDVNYIRRVTLNVGRIVAIAGGTLSLGAPMIAGSPVVGMQVSRVVGFCDREGGRFFQEWSGLFVIDGEQGDRIIYHYPRLQAMQGSTESTSSLSATASAFDRTRLAGAFRALPVNDANDGAAVLCFRSYLPGPMRSV